MKNTIYSIIAMMVSLSSCGDDDNDTPAAASATFTVTVTNAFTAKTFLSSGVFNTPTGATEPGPAVPGGTYEFSFNAGKGSYLSFATMFVQSNDLFYAPDATGLKLYNEDGTPVTGDITASISLWDSGTEVNEEPGVGMNQAPRQAGANTGTDENSTVKLIADINDGFTYPTVAETIAVTLAHDGGTMFTVTISNISDTGSLGTPLAPGTYAVHGSGVGLFTEGEATTNGLEALAEDGNPMVLYMFQTENSGLVSPFAPGAYAIHESTATPLFSTSDVASAGLESLAEDGDPSTLATELAAVTSGISASGAFNTPTGASSPAPIFPSESYQFTFTASEGDYLSLATMLVQTNDLFYGFGQNGIALFQNGSAVTGDVTGQLQLWDSYTEVNEYPGAGNNQAPRQTAANTGTDESANVALVNDNFTYPMATSAITVTISAQ